MTDGREANAGSATKQGGASLCTGVGEAGRRGDSRTAVIGRDSEAGTPGRLPGRQERAAGIDRRITGHSGRVGLATELTWIGAPEPTAAKAGGWKSSRMVTHYSAAVVGEHGAVAKYP